jgi:hypothetical protein
MLATSSYVIKKNSYLIAAVLLCALASTLDAADDDSSKGAFECFRRVRSITTLSQDEALTLCRGSLSQGPAECYLKVKKNTVLSASDAIGLCRCARGDGPAECFIRADKATTLSDFEILDLCTPRHWDSFGYGCSIYG